MRAPRERETDLPPHPTARGAGRARRSEHQSNANPSIRVRLGSMRRSYAATRPALRGHRGARSPSRHPCQHGDLRRGRDSDGEGHAPAGRGCRHLVRHHRGGGVRRRRDEGETGSRGTGREARANAGLLACPDGPGSQLFWSITLACASESARERHVRPRRGARPIPRRGEPGAALRRAFLRVAVERLRALPFVHSWSGEEWARVLGRLAWPLADRLSHRRRPCRTVDCRRLRDPQVRLRQLPLWVRRRRSAPNELPLRPVAGPACAMPERRAKPPMDWGGAAAPALRRREQ